MAPFYITMCRLVTFNSQRSLLTDIYREYSLSVDDLSLSIYRAVRSLQQGTEGCLMTAMKLTHISKLCDLQYEDDEIVKELYALIREVDHHVRITTPYGYKLTGLSLQGNSSLALCYAKVGVTVPIEALELTDGVNVAKRPTARDVIRSSVTGSWIRT
jgi:hypothetical protein